jgi:hypothetical protein
MQQRSLISITYNVSRRRKRLSMKDFFANAGIGPDTRFCVHGVPTCYAQNIHSLFSGAAKGAGTSFRKSLFQAA